MGEEKSRLLVDEIRSLNEKLTEYEREFSKMKNQEVTLRKLEDEKLEAVRMVRQRSEVLSGL